MDRPPVSEPARHEYDRIAERLAAEAAVKAGQMMGMPTGCVGGKAFAGLFGAAMVKLTREAHVAALAEPGATPFDPSGMGRPMKAWVQVPIEDSSVWPRLADQALAGLRSTL